MKKTIGIFAHVDAGKTTFCEQVLYHTKSIKTRGRVDHKNSFLDSSDIEKQRGITVFSGQAIFNYNSSTYYLIDTPGHVDFSAEMERAVSIMDYAIIILSAVEGVQAQTEAVWNILRKHKVPVFFFINKIDRVGADVLHVMEEIKSDLTCDLCPINSSLDCDEIDNELKEFIAERDDTILNVYLEGNYDKALWIEAFKNMIKDGKAYPLMSGSALQDTGIEEFLANFDFLTYTNYDASSEFGGVIYKIRHSQQNEKIVYIKALNGTLKVRDKINIKIKKQANIDGNTENNLDYAVEKVNQIRLYNGNKFDIVENVSAGDLFAVANLQNSTIGYGIGNYDEIINYEMVPTLKSKVIFDDNLNPRDVLGYFKTLELEDPALNILWDEQLLEIEVHIMGTVQLEVLKQIVYERYSLSVDFGPCEILYKETIANSSVGCGHFEPLRHYAEVHLRLEPAQRNSGISFLSECHVDDLSLNYQNLIRSHIFEREHHGLLTGSSLTDVKITLLIGRSHIKHTSGGDFRQATFRALRNALEDAKNILLEPYYSFKIEAAVDLSGKILSDIQKLSGTFDEPLANGQNILITGRAPVATFMNYALEFPSITQGKGKLHFSFEGYDVCHNEDEIIEKIAYNKNADSEYTSSSIFCSHGQSFVVDSKEAKTYMHCSSSK